MRGFQKGCPAVPDSVMAWVLVGRAPGLLERSCCLVGLGALSGGGGGGGKANKSGEGAAGGRPRCGPACGLRAGDCAGESPGHGQRGMCGCPRKAFPPLAKKEGRCAAAGRRAGQRRRGRGAFLWGAKATSTSFEPESNQRPKDDHTCRIYSPPLYQLSYRRVRATKWPGTLLFPETPQHHTGTPEVRPSGLVGNPFEESV